ncbi:hypothetical protein GGI11_002254 [Coemansia sp. RSA 2049]|nr:hypothetical protein GGI11_002254 [Coemansia sp. RSA 2049]
MAILAALGMGSLRVSSANASTSTLPHRHHRSAATSAGADNANVSSNASNDDNETETTDYFLQPRRKHCQLTPPSPKVQHTSSDSNSDSNALSFDTPMATGIMKYNTSGSSNSSTASPFTSKNSQLSKTAKAKTTLSSSPRNGSTANIAGIRRALRRAHTPEGLVLHYESRLRAFLGINEDGSEASNAGCENGDDDGDWLMVEQDEAGGMFSPVGYKTFLDDDIVVLEKALNKLRDASTGTRKGSSTPSKQNNNNNTNCSSPEIVAGIKNSLVAQWAINDSFKRMIVHTMCRYYGLVSFSDTTDSGHTALHICHPRFFNDKDVVAPPSTTFHHFLFNN